VQYTSQGWLAQVHVDDSMHPYWQAPRTFGFAARFSAWRMARKYNRLEKRGLVA
jgi:hypothetical protein